MISVDGAPNGVVDWPGAFRGWSGWRWSGLVLIGTDPRGREWSIGEVVVPAFAPERGAPTAILNHPTRRTRQLPLIRIAVDSIEQGQHWCLSTVQAWSCG